MAPISKKRAAMEMHLCHTLVPSLNMTGYSSDSSNQGGSETSNSSSQNLSLASGSLAAAAAAAAAANSDSPSPLQLSALSSLSALGLASHQPHLSALHQLNHSQLMSNLSSGLTGLAGAAAAAAAAAVSNCSAASTSFVSSTPMLSSATTSLLSGSLNGSTSSTSLTGTDQPKQYAKVNRVVLDKNSDEYRRRRERNNLAVKKSRTKSKLKTLQTLERVKQLKAENEELIQKIDILTKELRLLKDLFVAHASNAHGANITEIDLALLTNSEALQEVPLNLNGKFNGIFGHHH